MSSTGLFEMEVDGLDEREAKLVSQGITYPSLITLNSFYGYEDVDFRRELLQTLEGHADEKGMMPFFVNKELQKKYPPDLESTALYTAASHYAGKECSLDLAEVRKRTTQDGLFQTWIGRSDFPVDYTSQLIMCLCYGAVGMNIDDILERVLKEKIKSIHTLNGEGEYYLNPLFFIYYSIYIQDRGALPSCYKALIEQFIEQFVPANETESLMIRKICKTLGLGERYHKPANRKKPLFTNGHRKHIRYFSKAVEDVHRFSATREGTNLIK